MKITINKIIFVLSLLVFLYSGCSSGSKVTQASKTEGMVSNGEDRKALALEYFVNGGIYEAQANYQSAIKEYEKALMYDTSAGIYFALGKNYLFINKLNSALTNAKSAVKLDSNQIEYYDLLSDIYTYGNREDSAIVTLEKAVELDSNNIEINFKLARLYEKDKPLKAVMLYNRLLDALGPDWNIISRVAELQERLGNKEDAVKAVEKLVQIDPSNMPLKKMLLEIYLKTQNFDKGIALSDEILELVPDDIDTRQIKAQLLIGKNDWASAAQEFDYILKQPNVNLEAKVNIGANYFNKSLADSTLWPVTKSIFTTLDKDTTDWQIKLYLGAIAISEKRDSAAIEYFKYVTKNANWNVQAWIRLGGLYFDNKKYDESTKIMKEAIQSFPDDFAVNLILGLSLGQKSQYTEAEPYLKKSSELNPYDITALSAYAFTLNQLKKDEQAIIYLNRALTLEPDDENLIGTLALIYNGMKEYEKSDSLYERALELKPDDPLLNNNYSYSLAVQGIQLERALKMAELAVKADSLNSSYLDTIGWVHFKLGNYDSAKKYLESAIKEGGESSVMLDHLGDIEFKLGNKDKAIELWEKAYELDKTNTEIKQKIDSGVL